MIPSSHSALGFALRRFLRAPWYAVTMILSLGMGMAAMVAALGILDSLFLRAPPLIIDPHRVVSVGIWAGPNATTYPDYLDLSQSAHSFEAVGAFAIREYSVRIQNIVVPVRGILASSTLLPLLQVRPAFGRGFTADEDRPGANPVALVAYNLWRRHFARAAQAERIRLHLGGKAFDVIGVLPPTFTAPDLSPVDILLPVTNTPWFGGTEALSSRDFRWLRLVARLRAKVTASEASAEATTIYRRVNQGVRSVDQSTLGQVSIPVQPIVKARRVPDSAANQVAIWIALLALAVLCLACVNATNLLLARSIGERRDVAICAALGMPRSRLFVGSVLDVLLLVIPAVLFAALVAHFAANGLVSTVFRNTLAPIPVDWRMGLATAAAALIAMGLSVIGPTVRAARVQPRSDIGSGNQTAARFHRRALHILLVLQGSLAMVLVSESLLFAKSLQNALKVDWGFKRADLLIADVDLRAARVPPTEVGVMIDRILNRVHAIPGVTFAGFTNAAVVPGQLSVGLSVPGSDDLAEARAAGTHLLNAVTAGFLSALGVPLLSGRELTEEDVRANRSVVVVSERFAELFWPGGRPLGRCVKVGGDEANCAEVVGVVANRSQGIYDRAGASEIYIPLGSQLLPSQFAELFPGREIAIRSAQNLSMLAPVVTTGVLSELPQLTSVRVRTADEYLDPEFRQWRLAAEVIGAFGTLAVILASIGVLGTTAHTVGQRKRELAVRLALGARPADILILVVRESLLLMGISAVIGIIAVLSFSRFTRALFFGVSPVDIRILAVGAAVILISSALATSFPAIRASTKDPAASLRA